MIASIAMYSAEVDTNRELPCRLDQWIQGKANGAVVQSPSFMGHSQEASHSNSHALYGVSFKNLNKVLYEGKKQLVSSSFLLFQIIFGQFQQGGAKKSKIISGEIKNEQGPLFYENILAPGPIYFAFVCTKYGTLQIFINRRDVLAFDRPRAYKTLRLYTQDFLL